MSGVRRVALAGAACALAFAALVDASAASPLPGFAGCRSFVSPSAQAIVRPRSVIVACGDGNFYVTGIRWTEWTAAHAVGSGTGHLNDCNPNCAAGHFHAYRVSLRLSRPQRCGVRRELELTSLSWGFVQPKPPGFGRYAVERFRCR